MEGLESLFCNTLVMYAHKNRMVQETLAMGIATGKVITRDGVGGFVWVQWYLEISV